MSFKHIAFSAACLFLLAGCGNDSTNNTSNPGTENDGEVSSTEVVQKNKVETQNTNKEQTDQTKEEVPSTDEEQKATEPESNDETAVTNSAEKNDETSRESTENTDTTSEEQDLQKDEDDSTGFSVVDGKVSAAANVPKPEEEKILGAFEEYINSFNAKDIKRYENVLSRNPEGFNLKEDLSNTKNIFNNYDIHRTVDHVTITDYTTNSAYVFADVVIEVKQDNNQAKDEGKQLTQFVKEDGQWRVTSLQAIGNATNDQ